MNLLQSLQDTVAAPFDGLNQSTVQKPQTPNINPGLLANAIGSVETGGVKNPYNFSQYSGVPAYGDALGKYQVTSGELNSNLGHQFVGTTTPVSPAYFLSNPGLQDTYMTNKINYLAQNGLQPAGIIAVHNQGMTGFGNPQTVQQKIARANSVNNNYVNRALAAYNP